MGLQYGICNLDNAPLDPEVLAHANLLLAAYGPEKTTTYTDRHAAILHRAFSTTAESRREVNPRQLAHGALMTWDGRLDNREELLSELKGDLAPEADDAAIAASAYMRWREECFAKLVGDWILSVWDPNIRLLVLAKDSIGTRPLYYTIKRNQVVWSTLLDAVVDDADKPLKLDEEYIAGWLASFPGDHLTPYEMIHAVPASALVRFENGRCKTFRYWNFDSVKTITYTRDTEYEEHFRDVFTRSVERRLRSDHPVLAELSGGVDSSSIVCVADNILSRGPAGTARLDTVSYFNESEPNWDERPYFTKVEEKRGRAGYHIDLTAEGYFPFAAQHEHFPVSPRSSASASEGAKRLASHMCSGGHRVLLSGIGGDELTGGVPTPVPELGDLFVKGEIRILARQLKAWALNKRKPWFQLASETGRHFLPFPWARVKEHQRPAAWLDHRFVERQERALLGYEDRWRLFGPRPSFEENLSTLDALRRQITCNPIPCRPYYEKRYPYLDRDLVTFLFAVPRSQLLRPGHRRSLMRRALSGIVPPEILDRKRKAFVVRSPIDVVASAWPTIFGSDRATFAGALAFCK